MDEPQRQWEYIFDRPFLIAMIQRDAESPYFLMWVGNDELLTERVEAEE